MQTFIQFSHRIGRPVINGVRFRHQSTASFAELFRKSVDSAPVVSGDVLQGHVVGSFRPGSSASHFYIVDFGLKEEAVLTPRELPKNTSIGDKVALPIAQVEDDFNEPSFDHSQRSQISSLQAERYQLLTTLTTPNSTEANNSNDSARIVHGRFTRFNRGGATVKVLGVDAFVPRHHVLALERPVLGAFAPFYLLSMSVNKLESGSNNTHLEIFPVVSSYGGILLCLANLIAFDDVWKASGGGSAKLRLSYLRLLTRILMQKNPAVRRMIPASSSQSYFSRNPRRSHHHYQYNQRQSSNNDNRNGKTFQPDTRIRRLAVRDRDDPNSDKAWLNELPTGSWASSGKQKNSGNITGAIHNILRRRPRDSRTNHERGSRRDDKEK